MSEYTLSMRDECQGTESTTIEADTLAEAIETAREETEEWCRDGEWGIDGASIRCYWTLTEEQVVGWTAKIRVTGEGETYEGTVTVREGEDTDALWDGCGPSEQEVADLIDAGQMSGVHDVEGEKYCWAILPETREDILDGVEVADDSIGVEIEPDHDELIRQAGGDPYCEHVWTGEGEGGCDENPGVWSTGGTSMSFARHCRKCGLHRTEHVTGSQRNPGECDRTSYEQPESWCAECESEECDCEPAEVEEDS